MFDLLLVAKALGGTVSGPNRVSAPGPGHSRADRSLSILLGRELPDGFVVHSFAGDDPLACKDYVRQRLGLGSWQPRQRSQLRSALYQRPNKSEHHVKADIEIALSTFDETHPLSSTIGEQYLLNRMEQAIPWPEDLRFHRSCIRIFNGQKERHPAVMALLRDVHTNTPCGIQRIFLKPDGSDRLRDHMGKASLGRCQGACIKLSPNENVTLGLGLCEGVEKSLHMMARGWSPVWCTAGTSGMKAFPVLHGVESLVVFADNDQNNAGEEAALKCIARWREAGRQTRGIKPRFAKDWDTVAEGYA